MRSYREEPLVERGVRAEVAIGEAPEGARLPELDK